MARYLDVPARVAVGFTWGINNEPAEPNLYRVRAKHAHAWPEVYLGEYGWVPFEPTPGAYRVGGRRRWVRASGALWTADSPRMLFSLTELIDRTGIGASGRWPALSLALPLDQHRRRRRRCCHSGAIARHRNCSRDD